jgi:TIR domain
MKVFISWSGRRSNKVARALSEWLPSVIQAVKPWMSEQIAKGVRWGPEMARALQETRFGIVCLTPENLTAPWILFETGALSKTIESTHVCPYLLGLKPADLQGPLAQFQATKADPTDTLDLVKSINAAQGETALPVKSIESAFRKWWPELEKELQEISKQSATTPDRKKRTEMNVLEEILDIVRQLRRDAAQVSVRLAPGSGKMAVVSELLAEHLKGRQPEPEPEAAVVKEALRIFSKPKSNKDEEDSTTK